MSTDAGSRPSVVRPLQRDRPPRAQRGRSDRGGASPTGTRIVQRSSPVFTRALRSRARNSPMRIPVNRMIRSALALSDVDFQELIDQPLIHRLQTSWGGSSPGAEGLVDSAASRSDRSCRSPRASAGTSLLLQEGAVVTTRRGAVFEWQVQPPTPPCGVGEPRATT